MLAPELAARDLFPADKVDIELPADRVDIDR
jgi:hypothetical protein